MPYGGRPLQELLRIAEQDTGFLIGKNVKAILAACGTSDSNAMPHLQEILDIPIFGVIGPAAITAAAATKTGRIGVISTEATTKSRAYEKALLMADPSLFILAKGCPLLAPLTEQGHIGKDDPVLREALSKYLAPIIEATWIRCFWAAPIIRFCRGLLRTSSERTSRLSTAARKAGALSDYLEKIHAFWGFT
jgi:glutamate racemase